MCCGSPSATAYFYPRPPRGGRPATFSLEQARPEISIHALREEGDMPRGTTPAPPTNFYPRPPRGGRPVPRPQCRGSHYFYPRPPRGGRPPIDHQPKYLLAFLSTPSARRATERDAERLKQYKISIHALREEGDVSIRKKEGVMFSISIHALREEGDDIIQDYVLEGKKFLSTPSARRATRSPDFIALADKRFLSTPSARRATPGALLRCRGRHHFYPRPPRGGRPAQSAATAAVEKFLSTPSARRATAGQF